MGGAYKLVHVSLLPNRVNEETRQSARSTFITAVRKIFVVDRPSVAVTMILATMIGERVALRTRRHGFDAHGALDGLAHDDGNRWRAAVVAFDVKFVVAMAAKR